MRVYSSCDEKEFIFSVVIAIYNSDKFLNETIDSVISQSIGFGENIQLILVNDGSSDRSLDICLDYFNNYSQNVIVIDKENSGVSNARNVGVEFATGRYINFLDSDDKFDEDAFSIIYNFEKKYDGIVDVVTCRQLLFGDKSGDSWYNKKFDKGTRVIDLFKEPKVYLNSTNSSFFHKRIKNQLHFDEELSIAEDLKVVNTILMNKWKLGVVKEATYYYRIRTGSLVNTAKQKYNYYLPYLKRVPQWFFDMCEMRCGFIPEFLQYTLLRDMYNRINNNIEAKDVLSKEEYEEYSTILTKMLCKIDDKVIMNNDFLNSDYYLYLLSLKYGVPTLRTIENKSVEFKWSKCTIKKAPYFCLNNFSIDKNTIHLEGYCVVNNFGISPNEIKLFVLGNESFYPIKTIVNTTRNQYSYGNEVVFYRQFFDIAIPCFEGDYSFWFRINEEMYPFCCSSVGNWCPIGNNSIYTKGHLIVVFEDNKIKIFNCTEPEGKKRKLKFQKMLKTPKNSTAKMSRIVRMISSLLQKIPHKQIWIISDRHHMGGDNGQALFEYIRKNKTDINAYYAIDGDSSTYQEVKHLGHVLKLDSKKYKFYFSISDAVVSSHFDTTELYAFDYKYLKEQISRKKFVFLQHGITKDDVSNYYSRDKQRIDLFVTATRAEQLSIINNGNYLLNENRVGLLGFPRYDKLKNLKEKIIVIAPTWRNNLVSFKGKGVEPVVDSKFFDSYYFRFYHELMSSEKLHIKMEEKGYRLCYLPHFNLVPTNKYFEDIDDISIIKDNERNYNLLFSKASLWVTDYSSTAFDFAYLKKPVVYCQGDKDEFFMNHTYTKGYFDVERDGFGPISHSVEETIELIIHYLENDCVLEQNYEDRINKTFAFIDNNNSERVYKAIKGMVKNERY